MSEFKVFSTNNPNVTVEFPEKIGIKTGNNLFDELPVTNRTAVLSLKSVYGFTLLRDRENITGSGSIDDSFTTESGEYKLNTTASGDDITQLITAKRSLYQAGYSAETGIGIRVPVAPTGNQEFIWGFGEDPYEANSNGFYFGQDTTGIFILYRRAGTNIKIYQTAWNKDKLDGTGDSGATLDLTNGNIFNVNFSWYGYGNIIFSVYPNRNVALNQDYRVIIHTLNVDNSTSITNPNLPITASVSNGGTASVGQLFVGGRQFSIIGNEELNNRVNSEYNTSTVAINDSTFVPLISMRRKSAYISASIKLSSYSLINSVDCIVQLRLNSTLTGASFGNLSDQIASETALESDTSATALTNGIILWSSIADSSNGNGRNSSSSLSFNDIANFDIPQLDAVTLCVKSVSGAGNITVSMLSMRENW